MHSATLRRLSLLLAFAVSALAPDAAAQSELAVAPGQGTLNTAIENDTNRPDDRVYVLTRGAYYGVTREINNPDFTLRIKAAEGEGNRPVIHPGIDDTGSPVASRYFNLADDTYFDGIYFLAVNPQEGENATSFALNTEGMRLEVDDCVFQGGRSRLIEINADDTDLFFRDSQFRNLVRNDGSSNGRPIDYRTVRGDTLLVTNTSFINVSGYLVRYDGPVLNTAIFDHVTVYTTNRELTTNSFATQAINYRFSNSLVVNPYGLGQDPPDEGGEPSGVLRVDSLDSGIDNGFTEGDRMIVFRDNGFMITDDLQAFYQARTDSGDPIVARQLINTTTREYADANPSTVTLARNETYDITFTTPPTEGMEQYIVWLGSFRDGAADPGTWLFGEEDGNYFPATQPPPEDLSYGESEPAYTAGQGGYPLGDLNYFPALRAQWEEEGGLSVDGEEGPSDADFALRPAYPNPAASSTSLRLDLDAPASVAVEVFDALGRRVLALPAQPLAAGAGHELRLDARSLASGVYLARVSVTAGGDLRAQTARFTISR